MNFKLWLENTEYNIGPVYHGTGSNFKKFNLKKSTQGIIWFTSDKAAVENREVGAQGKGYILEMYVKLTNPVGWKDYDNLLLDQIISMGHDGAILPEKDGTFTGFVFDPSQVKINKRIKV